MPDGSVVQRPYPPSSMERLYAIAFRNEPQISVPQDSPLLVPVQSEEQADIDISGDTFDFVRSIRVYHIQFSQSENRDGDCNRYDSTRLGSYGVQGDYRWTRSSVANVPPASQRPQPVHCNSISYRSIFVDWRDHEGNYGFEEVRYCPSTGRRDASPHPINRAPESVHRPKKGNDARP